MLCCTWFTAEDWNRLESKEMVYCIFTTLKESYFFNYRVISSLLPLLRISFYILAFRGRSYKNLLEYLFFKWDPTILDENGEPIRVIKNGLRNAMVYQVLVMLPIEISSETRLIRFILN